ncbi:hypothetical protein R3X26_18705, partial [Vibrio sp. TH_r3]|uniref:hypothetical protein n=1 Tax=Vibrio sp. TH_r3 TaxID=3082084 RepID=UPI002954B4E7
SLKHTADVGIFASEVTGKFTLPKDKGITKTFITEATSFNEDISYKISTASNNIELDAAFDIGLIPLNRTENLSMGTLTFNVDGNKDALTYSANIPEISVNGSRQSVSFSNIGLAVVDGEKVADKSLDFTLGSFKLRDEKSDKSVDLAGGKLTSLLSMGETSTLSTSIGIDNLKVNAVGIPPYDFALGLETDIVNLNTSVLKQFEYIMDRGNISSSEMEGLIVDLVSSGLRAENINFTVNEASVKGSLSIKPDNYTGLRPHLVNKKIGSNTSSQFDFDLSKQMYLAAPNLQHFIDQYFDANANGHYTAEIKTEADKLFINGTKI